MFELFTMSSSPYKPIAELTQQVSQTIDRFKELHQEFRNDQIDIYKTGCSIHKVAYAFKEGSDKAKSHKVLNKTESMK